MPFRDYAGFNPEVMRIMTAAYDAAIAKLNLGNADPLTSRLAANIAVLASEGERDPARLCERALAELEKKPRR